MEAATHLEICSVDGLPIELPDDIRNFLVEQYHNDESTLQAVLDAMKRPPVSTICRVNMLVTTREEVERELNQYLQDYPLLEVKPHELFNDVLFIRLRDLEKIGTLNYSSRVPNADLKGGANDQCIEMNWPARQNKGWPMKHRAILCDRFCAESVLRGSDIFVRGIMAADMAIKTGETVAVYADIRAPHQTAVARGLSLDQYVGRCVYLGLGKAACNRNDFFREAKGIGIQMSQRPSERVGPCLPPFSGILENKIMLQNLPSTLVGHVLDPKPGETILDMCAAPGGKSAHLASLVGNDGTIVACDKSRKKVVATRDLFDRLGVQCITSLALDSTKSVDETIPASISVKHIIDKAEPDPRDGLKKIKKFPPESFDRILLDPPCSALGLRPKLFVVHERLEVLQKHATYQQKFVVAAVRLLKPGGRMTYSTCTISASENEKMIRFILDTFPEMELIPIDIPLGQRGLSGAGLTEQECGFVRRFDPHNKEADTMGFFLALFQKKKTAEPLI